MIDIIIPAYNAHSTILRTLSSIALQHNKDIIKVCIVDDCSDKDYSDEIKLFEDKVYIKQIKTEKNSGAGIARQVGIDNTDSEYIMFLDADDLLHDSYTITNFLNLVKKRKLDMIYGTIIDEQNNDQIYIYCNHQGCLHGKLYRREFIKNKKIRFIDSYFHEDNAFNRLVLLHSPNILFLDKYVYVYKNNKSSITNVSNNNFGNLEIFIDNMIKTIDTGIKHKCDIKEIANLLYNTIFYVYKIFVFNYEDINKDFIIKWSKPLLLYYNKYSRELSQEKIFDIYIGFGIPNSSISFSDFINLVNDYKGD